MSRNLETSSQKKTDGKVHPPSKYRVVLLNDDTTPYEFVVDVIIKFFYFSFEVAEKITSKIHSQGSAVLGVYSREEAETKANLVMRYASSNRYPLVCKIEAE